MNNPLIKRFLETGDMFSDGSQIQDDYKLSQIVREALTQESVNVVYHFELETGKLIFDKVLGRDDNDNFYNAENGNLESRKEEAKKIIVAVLLSHYKTL